MARLKFNEKRQRWIIRFYDQNAKRGWETLPPGTSARDAKRRLRKIEDSIDKKIFKPSPKIPTFNDWVTHWLEMKYHKVRHTTYKQYVTHINKYLNPVFGNYKVNEISLERIEGFVNQCLEKNMHANTICKIITTLSSVMKEASNPARGYAPLNLVQYIGNRPEMIKKEANMATPDEAWSIINEMKSIRDKLIVLIMGLGGLREGEVFGLRWGDIQWRDSQIFIRQTYNHSRFYSPKSKKSKRKIDLAEWFFIELRKWKLACPIGESDLVFPNSIGKPENATNWLRRVWHPARRRAGIREITPHSLRHFSGSFLLDQGENIGDVQDFLGHATSAMTTGTYRHSIKKQNREAAEKLGNAFLKANGCKMGAILPQKEESTQIN